MSKLLAAGFTRMFRDKMFWAGSIFMALLGLYQPFSTHRMALEYGERGSLDNLFFIYAMLIGFLAAAFCSLFVGTEYSDGTIRNKITAGHTRDSIYLSNFIVSLAATLLMCLFYVVCVSISGVVFTGFLDTPADIVLKALFGTILMCVAFCAVFTLISMLNQNKAVVAVISIIGVVVFSMAAIYINSRLNEPEEYESYVYLDEEGETVVVPPEKNKGYLGGSERKKYEFVLDFLPTGQGVQYSNMMVGHLGQMVLYSILLSVGTTGAGMLMFRKKDIR